MDLFNQSHADSKLKDFEVAENLVEVLKKQNRRVVGFALLEPTHFENIKGSGNLTNQIKSVIRN